MDILGLFEVPLWLMLLLGIVLLLYVYGTWNHTVWSSQGVPGPRPWPLVGNLVEIRHKSQFHVYTDWQKKYGRIVGSYNGVQPSLVITDLEMIREVMVKHFNNFTDRDFIRRARNPMIDKAVFFARGTMWKRIRNLLTPSFSTSKLKLMSHYVNRCSELLSKNIEDKARNQQLIDVKEVFGAFTMDVIAGTAFGLQTNSQTEPEEPFVQHCKKVFANAGFPGIFGFLFYIINAFPFLGVLMSAASSFSRNSQFFFTALEKMVDDRREESNSQHKKKSSDMLQMLVDAEGDPEQITDLAENGSDTKSYKRMTKDEILAQGFIVLIAGFETTATTLQYLTYNLAMHPDIQQRVFQEIKDQLGDAKPTYENVSQLKYLDATIRETLRMFPPVSVVTRKALEPITIKGVHIPADCGVTIPIYCIMHDAQYFPEPEVFNPDRFSEENASKIDPVIADLPFGYGPRKCIGMRLALLEIKLAAAHMFRKFCFVKCAETPAEVKLGKAGGLAVPDAVIKVKAELRGA